MENNVEDVKREWPCKQSKGEAAFNECFIFFTLGIFFFCRL